MTPWGRFRHRPSTERRLFLEAAWCLFLAKVLLLTLPFRRVSRRLGRLGGETSTAELSDRERLDARQVSWAIQAAARHIPLGFVCLPQAMAAKWMLRRRGIETTLYLGLRKNDQHAMAAHAWLRAGSLILTGRRESRRHRAIATFGAATEIPPELDTLLMLLRTALSGVSSIPMEVKDPTGLAHVISRHRVGAFLQHRLPEAVRMTLPEDVREALARQAKKTTLRALALTAELARLAARFQEAGIALASVKGPLLSRSLYGDLRTRHAGDLDLVISRDDLPRAQILMENEGYRRTRPHITLTPRQMEAYAEKEFEFQGGPHNLRVELRWWLDGLGDLAAIRPATESAELLGLEIPVPETTLNIIYLCQHGAIHGWRRLFWLVDVALLFVRADVDWTSVLREARARKVERALLEAAVLAEDLLGVRRPDALCGDGERRILARLVRNAREQIALPGDEASGTRNFLREIDHRLLLQQGIRRKWQSFQPHFQSVRNWEDLHLPDRWFWLYIPAGPVLWIRRRMRYASEWGKVGSAGASPSPSDDGSAGAER